MSAAPASRLLVLRHAHSSWAQPGQRDHQRPLDDRGRRQAAAMADFLVETGLRFDRVLCSTATRATETFDIIRPRLGFRPCEATSDLLYAVGVEAYYRTVRQQEGVGSLMLVGHNPMVEEFSLSLAGDGDPKALAALRRGMPTCALAVIDLDGPLAAIRPRCGHLARLVDPGELS